MALPKEPLTGIKIFFDGLLDFCVRDGDEFCQVGILKDVPGHELRFDVKEITDRDEHILECIEPSQAEGSMSLTVHGVSQKGVRLYTPTPGFHRDEAQDDPNDFRWLLDLEGPECYNRPLKINPEGFRSILTINNGLFFTRDLSEDEISLVTDENPEGDFLGKVALVVGAYIYFDRPDARAVLTNGNESCELLGRPGTTYEIFIGLNRPFGTHVHENDFVFHYGAVGVDIPVRKRLRPEINNSATIRPNFFNSPDTRCTSSLLSQTQSLVSDSDS